MYKAVKPYESIIGAILMFAALYLTGLQNILIDKLSGGHNFSNPYMAHLLLCLMELSVYSLFYATLIEYRGNKNV